MEVAGGEERGKRERMRDAAPLALSRTGAEERFEMVPAGLGDAGCLGASEL